MSVIGFDPSINNLGWAVIDENAKVLDSGVWHPSQAKKSPDRFDLLARWVYQFCILKNIRDVVIEVPDSWQGKNRSFACLSPYLRSVGVCEAAATIAGCQVHRVPVSMWKGKQSKRLAQLAARRTLGRNEIRHDESDAIAVAFWWMTWQRKK